MRVCVRAYDGVDDGEIRYICVWFLCGRRKRKRIDKVCVSFVGVRQEGDAAQVGQVCVFGAFLWDGGNRAHILWVCFFCFCL